MAASPNACPLCGQDLVHENAIAHLHRRQGEIEAERLELERTLRGKLTAEARKAAQADADRRVSHAKAALEKSSQRLLASVDRLKEQLAGERAERQELIREKKAELAKVRREIQSESRLQYRQALREQREKDKQRISREEEAKVERRFVKRHRNLERTAKTLEEENDRLQRDMDRLRAAEQGDFNEEELLELLRNTFHDDELYKTRRGRSGTDIFHLVRYRDGAGGWSEAGLIVYECKDTLRWSNDFILQAKKAGKTHGTSYLVLVSKAFPRGQKNLFVRDGVIVVHPALLAHAAHVVRRMVAEVHRTGLGAEGRVRKTEELLSYLTGEKFRQEVVSITNATAMLRNMLEDERGSHRRTWANREAAYNEIRETLSTIDEEIRVIVERPIRSRKAQVVSISAS